MARRLGAQVSSRTTLTSFRVRGKGRRGTIWCTKKYSVDKYAVEGRPLGARKAVPQARPHTRGDQALAQPTLQKIPFCTSLTDQTEGAVPLQNGGY